MKNQEREMLFMETRKFRRKRARLIMEKQGVKHINKPVILPDPKTGQPHNYGSYFAANWKKAF